MTYTRKLTIPYTLVVSSNPTQRSSRLYEIYQEEVQKELAREEEAIRQRKEDLIQEALDL